MSHSETLQRCSWCGRSFVGGDCIPEAPVCDDCYAGQKMAEKATAIIASRNHIPTDRPDSPAGINSKDIPTPKGLPSDILLCALMNAAASLEALSTAGYRKSSNKYHGLDDLIDVRGFAASRAREAREAIERYYQAAKGDSDATTP